jgi:polyisoprenoid-binding protein YceI
MKTILLLLLAASSGWTAPVAYEIRPDDRGFLELTVEKTGLLSGKKHLFTFSRYQGKLLFDFDAPERSAITLVIMADSIFCRDTWLDAKDLRKVQDYAVKDMLAADRYPRITFRSTTIHKLDGTGYEAQGILTIRDVSRPATVAVALNAGSDAFPLIEGSSRVRLTDFGLKPPTAALGTIGTKNEMSFRFVLTGIPPSLSASE